ncbi:amidase [Novosphingobium olei]|uniref:amidase n=1 Tax=Novosphingobium olei TaxID=2728851 RepID=UPI003089938C|nr:amidase [Novosphingobium olei]
MSDALADLDLVALANAIAAGDVTAEAATSSALEAATRHSALNAFVRLDPEGALEAARAADRRRAASGVSGPLHGVPLAHKDMFYRAGRVTGCGSIVRRDVVATTTSPLIERLDAAGAIEIGQLHMAEFAMGPTGHNAHLGRCGNPWNPAAISGGSSSGSGAAVGARIVAGALGSDTGGSVRLPAALCGVVGLKPTHGLLPQDGMMPLSESLDTAGPLARSSRSVARLLGVLTGGECDYEATLAQDLRGLTIGKPTGYFAEDLDPPVATAFDDALRCLADLGARVVDVAFPDGEQYAAMAALVWAPEAAAQHLSWLRDRPGDYGPQVRNRLLHGLAIPAVNHVLARRLRGSHLAAVLAGPFSLCDVIATPAMRTVTPMASAVEADSGPAMDRVVGGLSALTRPVSYLGLPALVTPMGHDARGLPIGLQLIARPQDEQSLLTIGACFEAATRHLDRRPPSAP